MAHSNDSYQPSDDEDVQPQTGGGRRLGDASDPPQPIPTSSTRPQPSASSKPPTKSQKKFATLGDFGGDTHNHDDDDSDEEDDPDLYTGGEKSGLAVQNPDDLKKRILEKARK